MSITTVTNEEKVLERRSLVFSEMVRYGAISQEEADAFNAEPLGVLEEPNSLPNGCITSGNKGFFCDYVMTYLQEKGVSEEDIMRGGLTVTTTMDPLAQEAAHNAVTSQVPSQTTGVAEVMNIIEPGHDSRKILAMTSSRDYGLDPNAGQTVLPQPTTLVGNGAGSVFKIFTAAVALQNGYGLETRFDVPKRIQVAGMGTGGAAGCPVGEIFRAMAPLIFTALGFAVASRAGFFNVGLSGQALVGWVFAGWFALANPDLPRPVLIIATVLIAMIAGGIAGAIPGILRAYLGTSEVIVTIMMNYILLYSCNHIIRNVFSPDLMKNTDSSVNVSANASYQTEWLRALTDNSRMNIGIFFAVIAVLVIWFLMTKTTLGFEIRAVGLNPTASDYAGMSAKRTIILSMIISGALAGVGGAIQGLGTFQNVYIQGGNLDIGFNGMSVALLASNSPLGIPLAAFLFGTLSIGAPGMVRAQIPPELIDVVTASIIFFIGVKFIFEQLIQPRLKAKGVK